MEKIKIELVIERGDDNLSGRVNYNNNLIVDFGDDVEQLKQQFRKLLHDFEEVDPSAIEFDLLYDIYALFKRFDFLNIGKVAKHAGINAALLRQYASQVKHPSAKQAKIIEDTIHRLAEDMKKARIYV